MTVRLESGAIVLSGRCGVEEVEDLVSHLQARPELPVDIGGAVAIHTTLWQALMVFRPAVTGMPDPASEIAKLSLVMNDYLARTKEL